jgi:predicted MPP superfamily phosphohydrolase
MWWKAWKWFLHVAGFMILLTWLWIVCFWNVVSVPDGSPRILLVGDPQMMGGGNSVRLHDRLNMHFNDWYQRYVISRSVSVLNPSHVVVLGDLFSSQFLSDIEWNARMQRYKRIMSAINVPLVAIAGNHDIGYASEQSRHNNARWERDFGVLNGELRIRLVHDPFYFVKKSSFKISSCFSDSHVLVWCNAMLLDGAVDLTQTEETWEHIERKRDEKVILLIHIPLHKPAGSCDGDSPMLQKSGHVVVTQNLLSEESTQRILATKPEVVFRSRIQFASCELHESHIA